MKHWSHYEYESDEWLLGCMCSHMDNELTLRDDIPPSPGLIQKFIDKGWLEKIGPSSESSTRYRTTKLFNKTVAQDYLTLMNI